MTEFSKNLVAYRKAAGYSQKEFAELLDIPVTTLSGYENAGREPKFETLLKIAKIFDVTVDELLTVSESLDRAYGILGEVKFEIIDNGNILIKLPKDRDAKEQFIHAARLATGFLSATSQLVKDECGVGELKRDFILKFFDADKRPKYI